MFPGLLAAPAKSFFLFGPRGTGKSSWVKAQFADAVSLDLRESVRKELRPLFRASLLVIRDLSFPKRERP